MLSLDDPRWAQMKEGYFARAGIVSIVPPARDSICLSPDPPVKLAGYFHSSLWDLVFRENA